MHNVGALHLELNHRSTGNEPGTRNNNNNRMVHGQSKISVNTRTRSERQMPEREEPEDALVALAL